MPYKCRLNAANIADSRVVTGYDGLAILLYGDATSVHVHEDPKTQITRRDDGRGSGAALCYHPHWVKSPQPKRFDYYLYNGEISGWSRLRDLFSVYQNTGTEFWTFGMTKSQFWCRHYHNFHIGVWQSWTDYVVSDQEKYYEYHSYRSISEARLREAMPRLRARVQACERGLFDRFVNLPVISDTETDLSVSSPPPAAVRLWDEVSVFGKVVDGHINCLINDAYLAAVDSIPDGHMNTVANVLQIAELVKDILSLNIGEAISDTASTRTAKTIADAWLGYRYEYSTTKMDILEYQELTERLCALAAMPKVQCHGYATRDGLRVHVCFDVDCEDILPHNAREWIEKYGFKLSAYNVWDMIPYSFMIDWFTHIGDIIESLERQGNALTLRVTNCWAGISVIADGDSAYVRAPYQYHLTIPTGKHKSVSDRTILMRVADTVALLL